MTVDEKITRLQESAMQEARSKGNAIVEQHKKALTHVFEQHKAEALIQADTRIKAEKTSVKQQLGMANSKAALELKRELGAAQKRFKKQLFKEVEEKLSAYMKTEKYQDLLVKYIEKAVAYSDRGEMTIYVNPTDADKKAYLEEKTGFTLSISKEDFIGGIRAVIPERNILVDYAFKGALEREYQKFTFGGGMGSGR